MKSITEAYLKVISGNQKEVLPVEQLTETTVPEHLQHIPENWDHHSEVSPETSEKIRSAMTKGSFTHFPLNDEHGDGDPDVIEHLTNHGYRVKDYKKGIATIKKQVGNPTKGIPFYHKYVDESIGSILEKTKATPAVKTSFINDPARATSKAKTHVVISTSPLAIAGMSTGTAWKDDSCMDMEGGSRSQYLEDDSKHGTHVAFLVHSDDTTAFQHGEPSKPIARIALKPFHSASGDTIFRPETKAYGTDTSSFTKEVSRWAAQNYPAEAGTPYFKNKNVYDDTNNNKYVSISKDRVEWHIKNGVQFEPNASIDHDSISHGIDFINTHFADKDPSEKSGAIQKFAAVSNLSTAHVLQLNRIAPDVLSKNALIFKHGDKASTTMMNDFMASNTENRVPRKMLMNPKLSDEHLDRAEVSEYPFVRRSKLKDRHMSKFTDSIAKKSYLNDDDYRNLHEFKDKLKPEHLIKLANHSWTDEISKTIMDSSNFNKDVHDELVNSAVKMHRNPVYDAKKLMGDITLNSKFTSVDDVEKLPSRAMYSQLSLNKSISSDTHKQLKDLFMKNGTGGNPDALKTRYASSIFGFSGVGAPLQKTITDHMQKEDFDKLAEHNYQIQFEDRHASNAFLDASEKKMHRLDSEVSAADDDDSKDEAIDKLHNHIENHAENINDHINYHVEDEHGTIGNSREHEKTLDRFHGESNPHAINNLKNYSHPDVKEDKYNLDSAEHHNAFVKPVVSRLNRMQSAWQD